MLVLVVTIFIFLASLTDGALTIYEVQNNLAYEANPLLAPVLEVSPVLFFITKVMVTLACLVFLYEQRRHTWALYGLFSLAIVYGCVMIVHARGLMG